MDTPLQKISPSQEAMTIVVPVFNRERLIGRCLDSLYAQTYRPIHVIVVDNNSSDGSCSAVSAWIRSHQDDDFTATLIHEKRKGAAFARQTGLDHTSTDKVMFFDSDDAMRPNCVAEAMKAWTEHPDADIVAWPVVYHYEDHSAITHSISGCLIERHLVHSILRTLGYAVTVEFIRSVGGWKGDFNTWDDFELGVRLLLADPEVVAVKPPMSDVYHQEQSITGSDYASKAGSWEFALDAIETDIRQSRRSDSGRLLDIVNYRRAILAADYAKENRLDLARPLLKLALKKTPVSGRPAIWFAYHFTRLGLRGAFMLVSPLL